MEEDHPAFSQGHPYHHYGANGAIVGGHGAMTDATEMADVELEMNEGHGHYGVDDEDHDNAYDEEHGDDDNEDVGDEDHEDNEEEDDEAEEQGEGEEVEEVEEGEEHGTNDEIGETVKAPPTHHTHHTTWPAPPTHATPPTLPTHPTHPTPPTHATASKPPTDPKTKLSQLPFGKLMRMAHEMISTCSHKELILIVGGIMDVKSGKSGAAKNFNTANTAGGVPNLPAFPATSTNSATTANSTNASNTTNSANAATATSKTNNSAMDAAKAKAQSVRRYQKYQRAQKAQKAQQRVDDVTTEALAHLRRLTELGIDFTLIPHGGGGNSSSSSSSGNGGNGGGNDSGGGGGANGANGGNDSADTGKKRRERPEEIKKKSPDEVWEHRYNQLLEFRNENGHCDVPYGYKANPSLSEWVSSQRRMNNLGSFIPIDRITRLNAIGFKWHRNAPELAGMRVGEMWEFRFRQLVEFRENHGHANIPQTYPPNQSLARWVNTQRKRRKKNIMTDEQFQRLQQLGFEWDRAGKSNVRYSY